MLNLLNEVSDSKFVTRKWDIVNDQSNANYDVGNEKIYNTEVLRSKLCDYNDAFILVKGVIITTAHNNPIPVAFKNCVPFIKSITKINGTRIDDAADLARNTVTNGNNTILKNVKIAVPFKYLSNF